MDDLKHQIEQHLIQRGTWVSTDEICKLFHVSERQLRQTADMPGLCSEFAISGDHGFMHARSASTRDFLRFCHRIIKHAVRQLVRIKKLKKIRHEVAVRIKAGTFEKDTGQGCDVFYNEGGEVIMSLLQAMMTVLVVALLCGIVLGCAGTRVYQAWKEDHAG